MAVSASEAFLHSLAERTFLKLWTVPNAHRAPGKEISDLIVVFEDDIVIFSDKACEFSTEPDLRPGGIAGGATRSTAAFVSWPRHCGGCPGTTRPSFSMPREGRRCPFRSRPANAADSIWSPSRDRATIRKQCRGAGRR
jgi:hypothetical protein